MLHLRYVAHSEIGLVRKNNQDSGYASPTMLVVADGMGGAAAGDLASAVAIDELQKADRGNYRGEDMLSAMTAAIQQANDHLAALVVDDLSLDGMGTTVCGAIFDGERFGIGHIGDSRGYLWRDGMLHRLTSDHSWVQSLVDEGKITEEQAAFHPHRSLLLKVLNGQRGNTPDLDLLTAADGDRIMFCSDGLCGLVEDHTIEAILHAELSLDETLDMLVEAAHAGGGLDNITIVLADVAATGPASTKPLVLGAANEVSIPEVRAVPNRAAQPAKPSRTRTQVSKPGAPVLYVDPEDARYRPIARTKKRRVWWLVGIALLAVLVIAGLVAGQSIIDRRYYLGVEGQTVSIYQGVPVGLGPVKLSRSSEQSSISIADLPTRYADAVKNNQFQGLTQDQARQTLNRLKDKADACIASKRNRGQPAPGSTPGATPSAQPAPTDEGC